MIDLERLRSGDHGYFEGLLRAHGQLVLRICMAYSDSTDHAEDLCQKVWIQAYQKRGAYQGDGSFEAWLRRLANNVCISEFRARKGRKKVLDSLKGVALGEEGIWRPPDPLEAVEAEEAHGALIRALADLPRREREAICLRILDGRGPQEVASIMRTTKATVRSNIRHGINRLRELLEEF